MAKRVTPEEVQAIMGDCDATATQIEPYITTANVYITEVFSGNTSVSATLLKTLEQWLSAHFVAITICRQTRRDELGDAVVTYAGAWGQGLTMTSYGQMVLQLDTTGEIVKQRKQQATIYAVKSFDD